MTPLFPHKIYLWLLTLATEKKQKQKKNWISATLAIQSFTVFLMVFAEIPPAHDGYTVYLAQYTVTTSYCMSIFIYCFMFIGSLLCKN